MSFSRPAEVVRDALAGRHAAGARLAFFLEDFQGGGVQKLTLVIASELARRGHGVDVVFCRPHGALLETLPAGVEIRQLRRSPSVLARLEALRAGPDGLRGWLHPLAFSGGVSATFAFVPALAAYLRTAAPLALFAATPSMNAEAALARHIAGWTGRLVVTEHNDLSNGHPLWSSNQGRWLARICRHAYAEAEAVVACSHGTADDVATRTGIPRQRVTTIYPPTVPDNLADLVREMPEHPWLAPGGPPVVLGVGRLGRAKHFESLIRAFALVRRQRPARLVILGEGKTGHKTEKLKGKLVQLVRELGVAEDLSLPGFTRNPFAYMARSAVLAVSSRYEGFCMVLAEALACGCPVVSTDCPSGPAEILDHGRFGRLVRVGDDRALGEAILGAMATPPDRERLRARGAEFSVTAAVDRYEALLLGDPGR